MQESRPVYVQVKALHPDARLPCRGTSHAAGWDLYAVEPVTLAPGAWALVPTGIAVALPNGYEMQVRPRSGLALQHGVTVLNAPGTIDADYRGPIGVMLINHGRAPFEVRAGERVAQAVVSRHAEVDYAFVDELSDTARGAGGFGHTGRS